jgi:hypothetical protein
MVMMKKTHFIRFTIFLVLLSIAPSVLSQIHKLTGRVSDQETGLPIEDLTVYINGTTTGTTTDPSGKFSLEFNNLPCELILSHVSYQLQQIELHDPDALSGLNFSLAKRIINLEEATVFTSTLRSQYLESFKSWFLGLNYEEQEAEILNDSILVFTPYDHRSLNCKTARYRIHTESESGTFPFIV